MPLFRFHAEADNLTHVQIEHGAVVIPGPYLVPVVTATILVSKGHEKKGGIRQAEKVKLTM
jgi:hypothetical protein